MQQNLSTFSLDVFLTNTVFMFSCCFSLSRFCVEKRDAETEPPFSRQENGQRQRELLANHFDGLVAILEERKQELVGQISREQDDKLKHVRSLIHRHGDELEAAVALVESAIQSLEEPHAAVFIQVSIRGLDDHMKAKYSCVCKMFPENLVTWIRK